MSEKQELVAPRGGIVWIASFQKSGNTWTRAFLHNLLRVLHGEAEQDINRMGQLSTWENARKFYDDALGAPSIGADRARIAALRPGVQQRIADSHDGVVFVKTHLALVNDRGYPTINTAATSGAIYIVRNPLDVAISYAHHVGDDIDGAIARMATSRAETESSLHSVHEVCGSWSEHVLSWTRKPHRSILVLRYEDMLASPQQEFTRLVRHLRLDAGAEQIAQAIELASFARLQAQESSQGFLERHHAGQRFFREGRAGQWKEALTREQIKRIVAAHHEQMARFDYVPPEKD
jgi:hypothetical protein